MTASIALAAAKSGWPISAHRRRLGVAAIGLASAMMFFSHKALADENGVSFWIPGTFGSLAATPLQPGWSLANIYYHTSVSAGADVARAREFSLGRVPANVTLNTNLNLNVNSTRQCWLCGPVLCIRDASARRPGLRCPSWESMASSAPAWRGPCPAWPRRRRSAAAPFRIVRHHQRHNMGLWGSVSASSHCSWNAGVHNYMTYVMADIPVGAYQSTRLSNIGIGHGAIDVGGGYTYFNPQTGHEFSGVLGFTYNCDQYFDAISKRRRPALRLGCIAVPVEAGHGWPRGLCLQGDRL